MALCCWNAVGVIMVFLLPVFFFCSNTFRFYAKVFVHYVNMMLASTLPIPLACFRPKNPLNTNYASWILMHLSKMFDISWEIKGQEHLAFEDAAIVVCNHQSSLDVIAMMEMWPRLHRCVSVQKRELLYAGPFGLLSWLSNSIFLDRGNSAQSHNALNNAIKQLALQKTKIWMFPEGTRNDQGGMLPFKKGAFHLAITAQIPIMPLVISPYSSFYNSKLKKFDNGGRVTITALPLIPTKGLTVDDIDEFKDRVRLQMLEVFEPKSPKEKLSNVENHK